MHDPKQHTTIAWWAQMRAKDYNYNWMSAAAMLDSETFLGAENSHNLFVCRKNMDDAMDEARSSLEVLAHVSAYFSGYAATCTWHGDAKQTACLAACSPAC